MKIIKSFFKKILKLWKDIHSSNTDLSSKRIYGGFGFIACVIVICLQKQELLEELLITSASMIGLDSIRQILNK